MLKLLRENKAQAVVGEYVLLFFIVFGAIGAMTIFFRRAIQARIRDTRMYMRDVAKDGMVRAGHHQDGDLWYQGYEPYYLNRDTRVSQRAETIRQLRGCGPSCSTGISRRFIDQTTGITTESVTAPPKDAD